jgi:hypothetical protein
MPINIIGGLMQGMAEGMQRGEEMRRARELLKLQQKRLDIDEKLNQANLDKMERERQNQARLDAIASRFDQPVEETVAVPGVQPDPQGPFAESDLAVPGFSRSIQRQPDLRSSLIGASLRGGKVPEWAGKAGEADLGMQLEALAKYGLLPSPAGVGPTAAPGQPPPAPAPQPGVNLPPGVSLRAGPLTLTGRERKAGVTSEQLQSIYGMNKDQADRIASLPVEAQERTIDNLVSKAGEASQLPGSVVATVRLIGSRARTASDAGTKTRSGTSSTASTARSGSSRRKQPT